MNNKTKQILAVLLTLFALNSKAQCLTISPTPHLQYCLGGTLTIVFGGASSYTVASATNTQIANFGGTNSGSMTYYLSDGLKQFIHVQTLCPDGSIQKEDMFINVMDCGAVGIEEHQIASQILGTQYYTLLGIETLPVSGEILIKKVRLSNGKELLTKIVFD